MLGKFLFGNDHTDKVRSDLLIALIPHIVRTPDYTVENMRGIYVGTDQVVKINYAPKPGENGAPAGTPAPGDANARSIAVRGHRWHRRLPCLKPVVVQSVLPSPLQDSRSPGTSPGGACPTPCTRRAPGPRPSIACEGSGRCRSNPVELRMVVR